MLGKKRVGNILKDVEINTLERKKNWCEPIKPIQKLVDCGLQVDSNSSRLEKNKWKDGCRCAFGCYPKRENRINSTSSLCLLGQIGGQIYKKSEWVWFTSRRCCRGNVIRIRRIYHTKVLNPIKLGVKSSAWLRTVLANIYDLRRRKVFWSLGKVRNVWTD